MKKRVKTTIGLLLLLGSLAGRAELLSRASARPMALDLTETAMTAVKVGETLSIECSPLFTKESCETIRLYEIENGTTNRLAEWNAAGNGVSVLGGSAESIGVRTLELAFLKAGEEIGARRIGQVEVWNDWVVLERGDVPLRDLMPTKCRDVTQVTIGSSVTNVGVRAFAGCSGLRSVELDSWAVVQSATLKALFPEAYARLTLVVLGEDVTAIPDGFFEGCAALTDVALPIGLTAIGSGAFSGCSSLASLLIPETVESIGERAFENCPALESVAIPQSMTNAGFNAFAGCPRIREVEFKAIPLTQTAILPVLPVQGTKWIKESAQANGVTVYRSNAISDSQSTAIEFRVPAGLKQLTFSWKVGSEANFDELAWFLDGNLQESISGEQDWTAVTKSLDGAAHTLKFVYSKDGSVSTAPDCGWVALNEGVQSQKATLKTLFPEVYTQLTRVVVGENVTAIPDGFFEGCAALTDFSFTASVEDFGDNDLRWFGERKGKIGLWIENGWVLGYLGECPETVAIPAGVKGIAAYAFADQTALEDVRFPPTLRSIGVRAFRTCTNLENLALPEGLCRIAAEAFRDCTWVQELALPAGLKQIADFAFANCTSLSGLVCPTGLVEIGSAAFSNCWRVLSISLPASLEAVGEDAFRGCLSLTGVTVPTHVQPIARLLPETYARLSTIVIAAGETNLTPQAFAGCAALEKIVLPETLAEIPAGAFKDCVTLKTIDIPESVVAIGDDAFSGCSGLAALRLPEGLTALGSRAFNGLDKLTELRLPTGLRQVGDRPFGGCDSLVRLSLPGNVATVSALCPSAYAQKLASVEVTGETGVLKDGLFDGCTALRQVALPANVTNIGARAFADCRNLEPFALPAGLVAIGSEAFSGVATLKTLEIPSAVAEIGDGAFGFCTGLQKVTLPLLPQGMKMGRIFSDVYTRLVSVALTETAQRTLEAGCFDGCTALRQVALPANVTNIGVRAFADCRNLEPFALPAGLVAIGSEAFSGVATLKTLEIPSAVAEIGDGAFGFCTGLQKVTMPLPLPETRMSRIFQRVYPQISSIVLTASARTALPEGFFQNCSALVSVELPENLTSIGALAFAGTGLTEIHLPANVTAIGASALQGLVRLTELVLPTRLETVGAFAFAYCTGLAELVFPASVASIGANAFDGCTSLKSVYFLDRRPQMAVAAYAGTPEQLTTHVLKGSTGWDGVATSKALPQSWPEENGRAIDWWEPNIFEVVFAGNGGEPEVQTVAETTGLAYRLPVESPVRTGAHFAGWWTEPENGGEVRATTKVELTRPHTLYAHWNFFVYTVAFDLNGADGTLPSLPMTYGTAKRLPVCPIRRVNFDFAGWSPTRGGAVVFADGAEALNLTDEEGATVTLHAVWKARTWTAPDYLDAANLTVTSDGDAAWRPDLSVSHDGFGSMRSGTLDTAPEGTTVRSVLKTAVKGNGLLTFWWKVNCEPADAESGDLYDYLELTVDGERPESAKPIAGDIDWARVSVRIEGDSLDHEIAWSFVKDDYDESKLPDVAWVDEVVWTPDVLTLAFAASDAESGTPPDARTGTVGEEIAIPDAAELVRSGQIFVGWHDGARTWLPGETYILGLESVTFTAVWRPATLADILDAPALSFTTDGASDWTLDDTTAHEGVAALRSGAVGANQSSWVELAVSGAGTLTFWWKTDGLTYRGKPANCVQYQVDGGEAVSVAVTDWTQVSVSVAGAGEHTVRWTYKHTRVQASGSDCAWLDGVVWTPQPNGPSVSGDPDATVTGDAENGFTVRPGAANAEVVVEIPDGVDAAKVTVEVSPTVRTVAPNGAAVRVVRGGADVTGYLDVPAAVGGVVDLGAATVKAAYANEPLDAAKGAVIDLSSATSPSLTTAPTRKGLVYRLKEGATLDEMAADADGDRTVGDGAAWKPNLTVKGGASGFYTITVEK